MAKVIKNFIIAFFTAFFTEWLEDFFIFLIKNDGNELVLLVNPSK